MIHQGSLLDLADETEVGELGGSVDRLDLGGGAWVDLRRRWLSGSGPLLERLIAAVPWRSERRRMYERVVDVPRLHCFYGENTELPDPLLDHLRERLDDRYLAEMGEPFRTVGLCWYRDGRDSVAWHGDTKGRGAYADTIVAIVSLGAPRRFLLRPLGGGPSLRWSLGDGDLLVMGGNCQRTWQHAVPKTASPIEPRISIQFRPLGVS